MPLPEETGHVRSHVVPLGSSIAGVEALHSPTMLGGYQSGTSEAEIGVIRITDESAQGKWERHDGGDELLLVFEGRMVMAVRERGGDAVLEAGPGDLLFIARGAAHTARIVSDEVRLAFLSPVRGTKVWDETSQPQFST